MPNIEGITVLYRLTHGHHVTHTNTKSLQTSTINYSINMAPIDDAQAALKSLQLGKQPSFTQFAKRNMAVVVQRCQSGSGVCKAQ
jgi:hypothetical protein